ncbi:nucleoside-diphosphate kinase [bacterium]|nr:nucleoside-diphosphate kinase [bacterium]MBU1024447.1 nucleoside-diphosphate kinase [bacterium]
MERTFMMIKPDGVQRGFIGQIFTRIESRGMKIIGMKIISVSLEQAQEHYKEHVGKDFYQPLLDYITSGPVVAMVIEGRDCVAQIRKIAGKTDPKDATPGTIRYDFGQSIRFNVVHAADSDKSAEREIGIYFKPDEILKYDMDSHKWIIGD